MDRTLLERDSPYLGKTIEGPSLFVQSRVSLRCRVTPRLVRSTITSDLEGHIIRHEDTNVPLAADTLAAANLTNTGIVGLANTFSRTAVGRVANKVTRRGLNHFSFTSYPVDWLSYLIHEEGRKRNSSFDLYTNPEQSARALEAVFQRTFAIFLQLNADEIFGNATAQPSSSSQEGTMIRWEQRVLMRAAAFYAAVTMLVFFIPAVIWTYVSLYHGFLVHQPTTLAGMYSAIYASDVDTAAMAKGVDNGRYGYGCFVGRDGKRHVGIERGSSVESVGEKVALLDE